jgi:NAD(P)-dependent dehydrogenase (short-subunit alcohol dehydrogenase family)
MSRLEGKSALITGSARGIGCAFAEAYIREGARVAIADINIERAAATAKEIGPAAYAVEHATWRTSLGARREPERNVARAPTRFRPSAA